MVQVFNETGDHGKGWKLFSVKLGAHANFQVSIVAVMGESYKGDIAIDDLAFVDCELTGELDMGNSLNLLHKPVNHR